MSTQYPFASAVETLLQGHAHGKSETHPYLIERFDGLYRLFDAERKNPNRYRKEEWIAWQQPPEFVDAFARSRSRGWYFVGALQDRADLGSDPRQAYKDLGYRLLVAQPFFAHTLHRISRFPPCPAQIERVESTEVARRLGQAARCRPIPETYWQPDSPVHQYVALQSQQVIGWARSVRTPHGNWCTNVHVRREARGRGIAKHLLARMLRDDRACSAPASVLLASSSGAQLYPQLGYRQIGTFWIFAPTTRP